MHTRSISIVACSGISAEWNPNNFRTPRRRYRCRIQPHTSITAGHVCNARPAPSWGYRFDQLTAASAAVAGFGSNWTAKPTLWLSQEPQGERGKEMDMVDEDEAGEAGFHPELETKSPCRVRGIDCME
ncbi:hypothetical protein VCV18_000783 [Metarhizium anisopliae]